MDFVLWNICELLQRRFGEDLRIASLRKTADYCYRVVVLDGVDIREYSFNHWTDTLRIIE